MKGVSSQAYNKRLQDPEYPMEGYKPSRSEIKSCPRIFTKGIVLLFVGAFFLNFIFAIEENNSLVEEGIIQSIELLVEEDDLFWKIEGYSPKGFRIVWSKNENPVHPPRQGDNSRYFFVSDQENPTSFVLFGGLNAFDGKGKYNVRICEYLGHQFCGVYSNEAEIYLGDIDSEFCEGCLYNRDCYSFGERVDKKYCSEFLEFINQKENNLDCENDFECKTGSCFSGKCESRNWFFQIFSWFKGLF